MSKPRNKPYRPRMISIPVTGLHRDFALQAHCALVTLRCEPSSDAFDVLGGIFNLVQVAIEEDERFKREAMLINGGAKTLNQVMRKVSYGGALHEYELASIRVAVNTIDEIFPRLDVSRLYLAQITLRELQAGSRQNFQ